MLTEEIAKASIVAVDFDGTLVYLETDWQALRAELRAYCRNELKIDESFESLDLGLFRVKRQRGEVIFKSLLEIVSRFELEGYKGNNIDAVIQPLLSLPADKRIAVFSGNCRKTIESIVPCLGLKVSCIVAKDDVNEPKPSGEGLKRILDYLATGPEEAVFIGDSEQDLKAGLDAGVRTLLWRGCNERKETA